MVTVTFPANGRYQFILLGKQRHIVCEQFAHCPESLREAERPGLESATSRLQVQRPNHYATTPQSDSVGGQNLPFSID